MERGPAAPSQLPRLLKSSGHELTSERSAKHGLSLLLAGPGKTTRCRASCGHAKALMAARWGASAWSVQNSIGHSSLTTADYDQLGEEVNRQASRSLRVLLNF